MINNAVDLLLLLFCEGVDKTLGGKLVTVEFKTGVILILVAKIDNFNTNRVVIDLFLSSPVTASCMPSFIL